MFFKKSATFEYRNKFLWTAEAGFMRDRNLSTCSNLLAFILFEISVVEKRQISEVGWFSSRLPAC